MKAADLAGRTVARFPGLIAGVAGGILVFAVWRFSGLPAPGLQGRLIPLAWVVAGIVSARRAPGPAAAAALLLFTAASAFWTAGDAVLLLAGASAAAGALSLAARAAEGRLGAAGMMLPLLPLIIATIPFTGDEPTNAALAESIVFDHDLDTSNNLRQMDPVAGVQPELSDMRGLSHHQPLFAILLAPGLLLGAAGFRLAASLFSVAAVAALMILAKRFGLARPRTAGAAAALLLPGIGVLGLAYPDWTAAGVLAAGAVKSTGRRGLAWALGTALVLSLLKLRFAPAGAGLVLSAVLCLDRRRRAQAFGTVAALTAALLAADMLVFGGQFFWSRYGNLPFLKALFFRTLGSAGSLAMAPVWMLVDQEAGLLWRAPWIILAVPGMRILAQKNRVLLRHLLLASAAYIAALLMWQQLEWHSMPTPWGRSFVLLLPLLVPAAAAAFEQGRGRPLAALSLVVSSAVVAWPGTRFNHLDGADSLLTALGPVAGPGFVLSFPSMVRPEPVVTLLWVLAWAAVAVLVVRGRNRCAAAVGLVALAAAAASSPDMPRRWEAEDLSSDYRIGCSLYPDSPDPRERMFWDGSQERLLQLSEPGDMIVLPVPGGPGGTVTVAVTARAMPEAGILGLEVATRDTSVVLGVSSRQIPPPEWISSVRGGRIERESHPGIVTDTLLVACLECTGGSVCIRPAEPATSRDSGVIYIDCIEVTR